MEKKSSPKRRTLWSPDGKPQAVGNDLKRRGIKRCGDAEASLAEEGLQQQTLGIHLSSSEFRVLLATIITAAFVDLCIGGRMNPDLLLHPASSSHSFKAFCAFGSDGMSDEGVLCFNIQMIAAPSSDGLNPRST